MGPKEETWSSDRIQPRVRRENIEDKYILGVHVQRYLQSDLHVTNVNVVCVEGEIVILFFLLLKRSHVGV